MIKSCSLIVGLFLFPLFLSAQTTDIYLISIPETPGPNEPITITVESSSIDLDTSNIAWTVNGTMVKAGRGEKRINTTSGGVGSRIIINVRITTTSGESHVRSLSWVIGSVDILWQGDNYIHPFYKGKKQWGYQSRLILHAIPNVAQSSGLIYQWSLDGQVLGSSSGVGKNSLAFSDSILGKNREISVQVRGTDNTILAESSINLKSISPLLLIYENNPLYGYLFNHEVKDSYLIKGSEVTFASFPLFMSALSRTDGVISFEWSTNTGNREKNNQVVYRVPENTSGQSFINTKAKNSQKVLQSAGRNFIVKFNPQGI